MAELALPLPRSRRRKPWRPVTWVLLLIAVALHIDGFGLIVCAWAGIDRVFCGVFGPVVLMVARFVWAVFQVERRRDES